MTDKDKEKKVSARDTAIAVIIVIIIIFGIAFALVWWMHSNNQKYIDRGCTASGSSDYLGNPTYWECPVK